MNKIKGSYKIDVNEVYYNNVGWVSINKKKTVNEIYKMFSDDKIEQINIMISNNRTSVDCSYDSFINEFCTLDKYYENIVNTIIFNIFNYLGIDLSTHDLKFLLESTQGNWDGIYRDRFKGKNGKVLKGLNISIRMALVRESYNIRNKYLIDRIYNVLYHEIGHFIHETYFNNKDMNLPTIGRSVYARTNKYEDFAEAFMDLMISLESSKNLTIRDSYMLDIIKKL